MRWRRTGRLITSPAGADRAAIARLRVVRPQAYFAGIIPTLCSCVQMTLHIPGLVKVRDDQATWEEFRCVNSL
jgi:hypothetical protein